MASETQICNLALLRVGGQTIASLDEASREAQLCGLTYEQCRDQLLRTFPWNFARRRAVLADLGTPATNWSYRYACPSDCLQALRVVVPGLRIPRNDLLPAFELGSTDSSQRVIHTDEEECELEYTARITDTTLFDPLFTNALAWLLASEIATPLTAKPDMANLARQAYTFTMREAAAQSLNEGWQGAEPDCEFQAARQ